MSGSRVSIVHIWEIMFTFVLLANLDKLIIRLASSKAEEGAALFLRYLEDSLSLLFAPLFCHPVVVNRVTHYTKCSQQGSTYLKIRLVFFAFLAFRECRLVTLT